VQRYGLEVNGGAELSCRWVAEHLVHHAEVHVFTTCAQDYTLWENAYSPGIETLNGVCVHRFSVDSPRDPRQFSRVSTLVFTRQHSYLDEIRWMSLQGPLSEALLKEIERERDHFDVFIFFTYLYATTYYGIQLVPSKSILVPTAHDEPTLYLSLFRSVFHLPRFILYLTHAERRLVHSVFRNDAIPSLVVGTGINVPDAVDPSGFRTRHNIDGPFILYVGRLDESKNLNELLEYYCRYKESVSDDVKLVLLGKGPQTIPRRSDILALGFVSEAEKFSALAASSLLVLPSRYESLSMVLLEAWHMGRPVLVNGSCEVLREQCTNSDGGLFYANYDEFAMALRLLLGDASLRDRLGYRGGQYVRLWYDWEVVEKKYLLALARFLSKQPGGNRVF